MMKRIGFLLALSLVTAACGDAPLSNVGDLSEKIVHGDTSTTLPGDEEEEVDVLVGGSPLVLASDLTWANDDLAVVGPRDAGSVLTAVWERGRDISSGFVQASRDEMVIALPEVRFPGAVPEPVQHVSSQLVFDTSSGLLDPATAAAFGLWSEVPYSVSRDLGQVAVFRVGQGIDPNVPDDDISAEEVPDGLSLTWQFQAYDYELFCRNTLEPDLCWAMASSLRPLRETIAAAPS
jgi:hypothetical protein